jgi:hypothetical protein
VEWGRYPRQLGSFVAEPIKHENDYVGSFVYQNTFTLGLGYQVFDSEATKLTFQGVPVIANSRPAALTISVSRWKAKRKVVP